MGEDMGGETTAATIQEAFAWAQSSSESMDWKALELGLLQTMAGGPKRFGERLGKTKWPEKCWRMEAQMRAALQGRDEWDPFAAIFAKAWCSKRAKAALAAAYGGASAHWKRNCDFDSFASSVDTARALDLWAREESEAGAPIFLNHSKARTHALGFFIEWHALGLGLGRHTRRACPGLVCSVARAARADAIAGEGGELMDMFVDLWQRAHGGSPEESADELAAAAWACVEDEGTLPMREGAFGGKGSDVGDLWRRAQEALGGGGGGGMLASWLAKLDIMGPAILVHMDEMVLPGRGGCQDVAGGSAFALKVQAPMGRWAQAMLGQARMEEIIGALSGKGKELYLAALAMSGDPFESALAGRMESLLRAGGSVGAKASWGVNRAEKERSELGEAVEGGGKGSEAKRRKPL